jgi:hypothetical protein
LRGLGLLNRADHATAWMRPRGVVEKCDVYGFGLPVLEMVSQWRRSFDEGSSESSREWFPKLAWNKYEGGKLLNFWIYTYVEIVCGRV